MPNKNNSDVVNNEEKLSDSCEMYILTAEILYHEWETYFQLKKFEQALHCIQSAIPLHPKNPHYWIAIGRTCHVLNKIPDAISSYEEALDITAHNKSLWNELAYLYSLNGQPREAERCYLFMLETVDPKNKEEPRNAKVWYALANIYKQQRKFLQAIDCYGQVQKLHPEDARPWYERGQIAFELGDFKEAYACAKKALEFFPEYSEAQILFQDALDARCNVWYAQAYKFYQQMQYQKAVDFANHILKFSNPYPRAMALKQLAEAQLKKTSPSKDFTTTYTKFHHQGIAVSKKTSDADYSDNDSHTSLVQSVPPPTPSRDCIETQNPVESNGFQP